MNRTEARNQKHPSRETIKARRRAAVAAIALAGTVAAVEVVPGIVNSFAESVQADSRHDAMVNDTKYEIPNASQPRRELVGGGVYTVNSGGKEHTIRIVGIDAAANLVNQATDGRVTTEEATDYLEAANTQFQREQGLADADIDPDFVLAGQPIRVPEDWAGVGTEVDPTTPAEK